MNWFSRNLTPAEHEVVAEFLRRLAAAPIEVSPHFADIDVLRVKAQLVRRWDAEREVQAPTDSLEPMQLVAGLAVAAVLLMWSLPSLLRFLPALEI